MTTKEILFLVGGLALGYLAFKQFSKEKTETSEEGGTTTDASKLADCQAQLDEAVKVVRTADLEGYKADFMARCMA